MNAPTIYEINRANTQVLDDIRAEMVRQSSIHGEEGHPDGTSPWYGTDARTWKGINESAAEHGELTWGGILLEEVFEALAETDPVKLRKELLQVAAVAGSWAKDLDRRSRENGHTPRSGCECVACQVWFG